MFFEEAEHDEHNHFDQIVKIMTNTYFLIGKSFILLAHLSPARLSSIITAKSHLSF